MQNTHKHDIVIIGAGVSGSACARELSRYRADILVIEKEADVGCATSKANSAIVHAGYDAANGSLMARLNVAGSRKMEALSAQLGFPYRRNGSMVVCLAQEDLPQLQKLYENGVANGVEGLQILSAEAARAKEPHLSPAVVAALWAPSGAIVCPFQLTVALAENAFTNGVQFAFNTAVTGLEKSEEGWLVHTDKGDTAARCVVNAAGVYADRFHNLVSADKIHITPRKGEYLLLDRREEGHHHVDATIFQLPGKYGKGVLVSPTVHGNLIVGPTARDIQDKENTATTAEGLAEVAEKAALSVVDLPMRSVITSFTGLRAHEDHHEFVIGVPEDAPGFVDVAGIESPGLSSAPAIGEMVAGIVQDLLGLEPNPAFVPRREAPVITRHLSPEAFNALIQKDPAYGRMVCRCCQITEGEILDAIRRPLGATTVDGVKHRAGARMGRCQGGFCTPRILELLARELGVPMEEVTQNGGASRFILGANKDAL